MRIGILGTGNMAAALGGAWAGAAHQVLIGGRDPAKAAAVAQRIGAAGHGTSRMRRASATSCWSRCRPARPSR
ncbi:NAD(P)-binding domain-containing protein [Dactylosporangium sp. NBC_01737]|uniref:NAD(P)-binding domain-containing protein n=1 Tax=Dactylosporangium sp. NBC_01737 TaxID=2975959 RepID=UPI002E10C50B|nr:NAD(P)-binding domain-containing protein [Dactylosporangium sp. NBC_01737]